MIEFFSKSAIPLCSAGRHNPCLFGKQAQAIISKYLVLVCTACLLCVAALHAQEGEENGFEIISHRARLRLFPQSVTLQSRDTLSVRIVNRKIEKIPLRFIRYLTADDVLINGKRRESIHDGDYLILEDIPSDTLLEIIVSYSGSFGFRSEFSEFNTERAVFSEDEVLPNGPKAYRFVRLSLVVPIDWTTIAAGREAFQNSSADSMTTVWEFDQPLLNIGWICAGKYRTQEERSGNVPISTHLFQEDSAFAGRVLSLIKEVLPFYDAKFSPYRFPKLAIVEVEDWFAGRNVLAVAAPSFILVKKLAFTTNDVFNQVDAILPHEIAHQWWPMTVFIEDQDAAFLSEGMCEYSALLFNESKGIVGRRDSLGNHPLLRSLIMKIVAGKDMPLEKKADLRSFPTQYLKSSYVHNMLRRLLGDSVFMLLYREYAIRFAEKKASTTDFKKLAEDLSGKKLDWFFDQWIKKRGIPQLKIYNVKSVQEGEKWRSRGRVRLVGYEKYTTFVDVGAQISSGMKRARLFLGVDSTGSYRNDVPFEIVTEEKPTLIKLDPAGDILKIQKLPVKLGDLRDPSDGVMIVGTRDHSEYLLSRARRDSADMDKSGWSLTIKYDSTITLGDLQQAHIFLYGGADENGIAAELQVRFPLHVHNDSIVVRGEALSDSTLTLIQIIENPYNGNGTVCWITPLSDRAQPELLPYDASWTLVRGKDEISSGTWEVEDEDLVIKIK